MAQATAGVRAVLNIPWVYEALQFVAGSKGFRDVIVSELIRPFPGAPHT
jgi:hypothetical protein